MPHPGIRRPVLFLHVPKTAGTSFLTVLCNVFGDAHVRRLDGEGELEPAFIDRLVAGGLDGVDCLAGHIPAHLFIDHLAAFRPFTLLRDPVDRVLSLFRFIRAMSPPEQARIGLAPGFGFEAFMACRHPEVLGQIENGMCRMLCGDPAASDPETDEFWRPSDPARWFGQAVAMLGRCQVGLVEDMPGTLALARRAWGVPFALEALNENASVGAAGPDDHPERSPSEVLRVIQRNTLDLALHRVARELLAGRQAGDHGGDHAMALAHAVPGARLRLNEIPGRRGFHPYERDGFGWLQAGADALVAFDAGSSPIRLSLKLYRISEAYPADGLAVAVNGIGVPVRVVATSGLWVELETGSFHPVAGVNLLTLRPAYSVPARFLDPRSLDHRDLSMALATLSFLPASPS